MKKRTKHQELRQEIVDLQEQLKASKGFCDAFQMAHAKTLDTVFGFLSKYLTQDELAHEVDVLKLLERAVLTAETNERREVLMEFKLLSGVLPYEEFLKVHNLIARLEAGPWLKEAK